MPDIKRLNYFTGQFLEENDFNDEQAYHLQLQRDHERLLHTPGVAEGLSVTASLGADEVVINGGTAYDGLGRRLVLSEDRTVDLSDDTAFPNGNIYVTIRYAESKTDEETSTGVSGDSRWTEAPLVEAKTTPPVGTDPNFPLLLAVVTKSATGLTVNSSGRLLAGTKGGDLEVNSLKLIHPDVGAGARPVLQLGATGMSTFNGALTVSGAGGLAVTGASGLAVTGNIAVGGTVDGRDVGTDASVNDAHRANTANPHATTAAQVDVQGGANRIVTQINAGTGVIAEPRIDAALARQSALAAHTGAATGAHAATAISAAAHANISGTNVQTQLQEIVTDLASQVGGSPGTGLIGGDAVGSAPNALPAGTLRGQLGQVSTHLNALSQSFTSLASQTGPTTGATMVGNDAFGSAPNNVAAGNVRSQLTGLLTVLTNHLASGSAHAAANLPVADSGNHLTATNVEAALAEILSTFQGDHYRAVDGANQGQHKAIRQPFLGSNGGKALLFDSAGVGSSSSHVRMYNDTGFFWLTINASWNGSAWARDNVSYPSTALKLSRLEFELVFFDDPTVATFTSFTRTWRVPMWGGFPGWEIAGSFQDVGRAGSIAINCGTAATSVYAGGSVNFHSRFPSTPSSITFSTSTSFNMTGGPFVISSSQDGFGYYFYGSSVAVGSTMYWYGTYTAIV